jgi:hypothetical protein
MADNYTIEARSLNVLGLWSHDFYVLRDPSGNIMAEIHGLATDRQTGLPVLIGTDPSVHSLQTHLYVRDLAYATQLGVAVSPRTYIVPGQSSQIVFSGSAGEALGRFGSAVSAMPTLNRLNLDYPSYGFNAFSPTVNSNSAYRTFGEIMGVAVHNFSGAIEPGFDNRMISSEQIQNFQYQSLGYGLNWTNIFHSADQPGPVSNTFTIAIPYLNSQPSTTNPMNPTDVSGVEAGQIAPGVSMDPAKVNGPVSYVAAKQGAIAGDYFMPANGNIVPTARQDAQLNHLGHGLS